MDKKKPIPGKSIPLCRFKHILAGINADTDIVSFQREISKELFESLGQHRRLELLSDEILNADDQCRVVEAAASLDIMVTISTTTAHLAACLGTPLILLCAKRQGPQWFWRVQAEHDLCLYPNVQIVLGTAGHCHRWWEPCLEKARTAVLAQLALSASASSAR
jgi:ADP-heptose:LPS heptosyltransferase